MNVEKSHRLGLELGIWAKISGNLNLSGNLTMNQSRIKKINSTEGNEDVVLKNTSISFSPDIIANAMVQYKPMKGLQLNLNNQYVGKQYLDNLDSLANQLKDYFLTDFNAQYEFKIVKQEVSVQFLLNNIFNKKYVNNGFSGPYYYAQAGRNFMLGLKIFIK